jgi:glutamate dehydrogenase
VLERTTRWILANVESDANTAALIDENKGKLASLRADFGEFVAGEDKVVFERRVAEIEQHGAEPSLARSLITLRFLDQLLEILRVAKETGTEPLAAGGAYYKVSEQFHIPWLRQAIFGSASEDRWEQRAAQALAADLSRAHFSLTRRLVATGAGSGALDPGSGELGRFQELMEEIRSEEGMSVSGLSVAVREIALIAERVNGSA